MGNSVNITHKWLGNWAERIYSRVHELGYSSIQNFLKQFFLKQFPAESYLTLVSRLDEDIAPIQLECAHFKEAEHCGSMRDAAVDSLVRDLIRHLPEGWEGGKQGNFLTICTYVCWLGRLEGSSRNQVANLTLRKTGDQVWSALEFLQPSLGWLPTSQTDEYIVAAFASAWPEKQ